MRTNIVLDDALIEEALKYTKASSKRELVDLALREFVLNRRRRNIMDLYGKGGVRTDYDYKSLRGRQTE